MARLAIDGMKEVSEQLNRLDRGMRSAVKRIVMAGAKAEEKTMAQQTQTAGHVRTGAMMGSVGSGQYHETLGGGEINVYPQGADGKGTSNALKAYVINYGRGKKSKKMGDKFITGKRPMSEAETAVGEAMRGEAEIAFREMGLTE